ncbi:MAG: bifunctional methylenetetrahydrofolate dehydrogenase/methenyltetrahydrofolate cyclohydrolase FolD [Actinobacteria bacterium]|nr:bifunctional methylenetetrahydrofolate dehydrogenase/methenyltetrahydrofolate cyclohydrolase FolD [Actinomycetota bacterium]
MNSVTTAQIIDGKAVAASVRAEVAQITGAYAEAHGRAPSLATILVGDDPASDVYVTNKHKACNEVGIKGKDHRLPADTQTESLANLIKELNADDEIDGILLQLPLPPQLDADAMTELIDPAKDVDGLTVANAGRVVQGRDALVPCTPSGVMRLLAHVGAKLDGAEAVVLGRSNLVGRPVASLLLAENATVTVCHSHTHDLPEVCRRADVLVTCVGSPGLVSADMIKPGAIVIDVGTTRGADGLCGDVEFEEAIKVAAAITPVPGGVGPMTIACLLANTVKAAQIRAASAEG